MSPASRASTRPRPHLDAGLGESSIAEAANRRIPLAGYHRGGGAADSGGTLTGMTVGLGRGMLWARSGGYLILVRFERRVNVVAKRSWNDVDPRVRHAFVIGGAFEAGLKIATLIDLAQRPAATVRGSKRAWAAALILVNSGGIVPIVYLLRGRRVA